MMSYTMCSLHQDPMALLSAALATGPEHPCDFAILVATLVQD
jgi:hypothetical protein